ncbi:OCIA domain-containing protein 1 isoform X2 [Ambystoma mexicanum]|uniref:OCIA domain-containing protein 1 isoform X2 n=1 Tax=Ambystoma mexicanum TaxID=8296 RepID=UPI0037E8F4EC
MGVREMAPQAEGNVQHLVGVGYVPTEEERRAFKECNQESFWYRSLPFSTLSMLLTQGLISRGILTSSTKFGSFPKVAFAGLFGYIVGKMSYMKVCQEKFKNLENSVLGEALRQGRGLPSRNATQKSEFEDTEVLPPSQRPEAAVEVPASSMYSGEYSAEDRSNYEPVPFSASLSESSPSGITDHTAQEPAPLQEEAPKRKPVTYDELRSKNRDTYEVSTSHRGDVPARPSQERASRTKGKVNKYGDEWEE